MNDQYALGASEIQELARIEKLLAKHDLEIDRETDEIVRFVVHGKTVSGVEKLLSKSWFINQLLRVWGDRTTSASVRQRALEFMADVLGHTPQGPKTGQTIMDVVIGDSK